MSPSRQGLVLLAAPLVAAILAAPAGAQAADPGGAEDLIARAAFVACQAEQRRHPEQFDRLVTVAVCARTTAHRTRERLAQADRAMRTARAEPPPKASR